MKRTENCIEWRYKKWKHNSQWNISIIFINLKVYEIKKKRTEKEEKTELDAKKKN